MIMFYRSHNVSRAVPQKRVRGYVFDADEMCSEIDDLRALMCFFAEISRRCADN